MLQIMYALLHIMYTLVFLVYEHYFPILLQQKGYGDCFEYLDWYFFSLVTDLLAKLEQVKDKHRSLTPNLIKNIGKIVQQHFTFFIKLHMMLLRRYLDHSEFVLLFGIIATFYLESFDYVLYFPSYVH